MTRAPHGRTAPGPGDARRARPGAARDRFRPCGAPTRGLRGRTVPAAAVRRRCAEPPPYGSRRGAPPATGPGRPKGSSSWPARRARPSTGPCPRVSSRRGGHWVPSTDPATGFRPPDRPPPVPNSAPTAAFNAPDVGQPRLLPAPPRRRPGQGGSGTIVDAAGKPSPQRCLSATRRCAAQPLRRGADRALSPRVPAAPPAVTQGPRPRAGGRRCRRRRGAVRWPATRGRRAPAAPPPARRPGIRRG